MSTPDQLDAALRLLQEQVGRYGATRIHKLYFKDGEEDLLVINTLKKVVREGFEGFHGSADTKAAVLRFQEILLAERDKQAQARLYHILKNVFDVGDQAAAKSYLGGYTSYRIRTGTENSDSPYLIIGRIEIEHVPADDSYKFTHISDDSGLETDNPRLIHTGPFYVLVNRVYLVGLSGDVYGASLRPIILQTPANPQRVPMRGVVLTHAIVGNVPVAARTVLYHDTLHAEMKDEHSNATIRNMALAELRTDAWNSTLENGHAVNATNILGW